MKQTKFLAVLLTVVMLFGICAASSNLLLQGFIEKSNAQQTDNDLAGLFEGLEIDPDNISGMISGLLGGSVATTDAVEDDELSTITTIVQALLGGTQEGETTLDAIREKLGDLGGTVTDNELVQAIVSTLLGFDFSNFDMSMLTSNEFITALMGNLGGLNVGGATQVTTTVAQGSTQSAVITTIPQVSTTASAIMNPSVSVPTSAISTIPGQQQITTTPMQQQISTQQYLGNSGTIIENTTYPAYNTTGQQVVPTVPNVPGTSEQAQEMPDGTKSLASPKMIVGVLVLLLSGISVIAVVMVLRKKS